MNSEEAHRGMGYAVDNTVNELCGFILARFYSKGIYEKLSDEDSHKLLEAIADIGVIASRYGLK